MGTSLTKLSCVPCQKRRKRKIGPSANINIASKPETRSSSQILNELQDAGFFTACAKTGGVRFVIEPTDDKTEVTKRQLPRRLPKLKSTTLPILEVNKDSPSYDTTDKELMVEIRRIAVLSDKGKMAKLSEERRKAVLARKEAKLRDKIARTEEKLRQDDERLTKKLTDESAKEMTSEETAQEVMEQQNETETTGVQNVCTGVGCDGLPDVST